ncbi:MAG: HNH endonuclease signature motif containing protein, partial [Nocardioides sp.]
AAQTLPVTGDGLDLPPGVVRRLACDAEVLPVLLGAHGEVLDVGRAIRTVTVPIWNALVVRDRHCAFPRCHQPPVMCHAHHIRHWADHGETELDNLLLRCGHRVIHHTPWEIRINPKDRKPEFSPPPRHGQTRKWIRYRPRID